MTLDPKTWWYVTRATGFVSWALLAVAVLWGLFITNKTLNRSTAPAWVLDLHRQLGGLAVVFVAVHVAALPLDGFTQWGWSDLFVPMATSWNPGATASANSTSSNRSPTCVARPFFAALGTEASASRFMVWSTG